MMFAVQSLERPLGSRRSEKEEEDVGSHQEEASSREHTPQKPDRSHTRAGIADDDDSFRGLLSQLSVRAEDWDGDTREQLNRRTMVLYVVSRFSRLKASTPFL